MAGIGDYIHATKKGYLDHSISLHNKMSPLKPNQIYKSQVEELKKDVYRKQFSGSQKERTKLENMLNLYFHPAIHSNIVKGELNERDVEVIKEATMQYVLENSADEIYLDPNTLAAVSGVKVGTFDELTKEAYEAARKLSQFNVASSRSIASLENKYHALLDFRAAVGKEGVSSSLYNRLVDLDNQYNQFLEDVKEYVERTGNEKIIWRTYLTENSNGKKFDEELNSLIRVIKNATAVGPQGLYGEVILKATNYALNNKGRIELQKLLSYLRDHNNQPKKSSKGVRGDLLSFYAVYDPENYIPKDPDEDITGWWKHIEDSFSVNTTEDKVDCVFNFRDFGNTNLSIKNYDLSTSKNIHLLKGKNLLALVQDYGIFINHFLNIVGTHRDDNFPDDDVAKMHEAMRITAFVKAISGGVFTNEGYSQKVDLFVVNDASQGGYKVYYLQDLLNNILSNINLVRFEKYPTGIWMENSWIDGEPDHKKSAMRITKLIGKMREMQLNISISSKALE